MDACILVFRSTQSILIIDGCNLLLFCWISCSKLERESVSIAMKFLYRTSFANSEMSQLPEKFVCKVNSFASYLYLKKKRKLFTREGRQKEKKKKNNKLFTREGRQKEKKKKLFTREGRQWHVSVKFM